MIGTDQNDSHPTPTSLFWWEFFFFGLGRGWGWEDRDREYRVSINNTNFSISFLAYMLGSGSLMAIPSLTNPTQKLESETYILLIEGLK